MDAMRTSTRWNDVCSEGETPQRWTLWMGRMGLDRAGWEKLEQMGPEPLPAQIQGSRSPVPHICCLSLDVQEQSGTHTLGGHTLGGSHTGTPVASPCSPMATMSPHCSHDPMFHHTSPSPPAFTPHHLLPSPSLPSHLHPSSRIPSFGGCCCRGDGRVPRDAVGLRRHWARPFVCKGGGWVSRPTLSTGSAPR